MLEDDQALRALFRRHRMGDYQTPETLARALLKAGMTREWERERILDGLRTVFIDELDYKEIAHTPETDGIVAYRSNHTGGVGVVWYYPVLNQILSTGDLSLFDQPTFYVNAPLRARAEILETMTEVFPLATVMSSQKAREG